MVGRRAATTVDATAHVAPLCHHESIIVTAVLPPLFTSYPAHPIAHHRHRHCVATREGPLLARWRHSLLASTIARRRTPHCITLPSATHSSRQVDALLLHHAPPFAPLLRTVWSVDRDDERETARDELERETERCRPAARPLPPKASHGPRAPATCKYHRPPLGLPRIYTMV